MFRILMTKFKSKNDKDYMFIICQLSAHLHIKISPWEKLQAFQQRLPTMGVNCARFILLLSDLKLKNPRMLFHQPLTIYVILIQSIYFS